MSESTDDDVEQIREEKREELLEEQTGAETPDEPVEVSGTDDLQTTISEHDVVLVDCYADWCGPCKMMEPVVADIAADTDATVAKVDVDQNQEIAAQLGAQSIPTFVLYVDGEPAERLVGAQDEGTFRQLIEQAS
jgi:thioredoxin 1